MCISNIFYVHDFMNIKKVFEINDDLLIILVKLVKLITPNKIN